MYIYYTFILLLINNMYYTVIKTINNKNTQGIKNYSIITNSMIEHLIKIKAKIKI